MDFDFDDEPKKKKKKKPKKGKKKRVLQTRVFYETKIAELNERLARLRTIFERKTQVNNKLIDELVSIEEDREDVCQYLDRTLKNRKLEIVELHNTFIKTQKDLEEYKDWSQKHIADLQKQYAYDRKQLLSEIELGQKALHSLDEFRLMRDEGLARYETNFENIAKLERQAKEDLFNMEQKAVVQKNVLKKEVEARLQFLVEDFMHSNEIRNASYTRNLIHENIVLKKRLDKIVKQNIRTMEEREKQHLKTKETIESYTSLEQLTDQLRRTIDNKNDIIQNITARIDRMRTRYISVRRYRRLHEMAESRGLFNVHAPNGFQEINRHLDRLKFEKNAFIQQQRAQDQEIQQMKNLLNNVLGSIERTSLKLQQLGPGESLEVTERRTTIGELIFLTLFTSRYFTDSCGSALYHLGSCGFIERDNRFKEYNLNVLYTNFKSNSLTDLSGRSESSKHDKKPRNLKTDSVIEFSSVGECSSVKKIVPDDQIFDRLSSGSSQLRAILEEQPTQRSVGSLEEFQSCIKNKYTITSESDYDIILTWQYLQRLEEKLEKENSHSS